jgi:hypothetical protein
MEGRRRCGRPRKIWMQDFGGGPDDHAGWKVVGGAVE